MGKSINESEAYGLDFPQAETSETFYEGQTIQVSVPACAAGALGHLWS